MPCRERDELTDLADEENISADQKSAGLLLDKRREGYDSLDYLRSAPAS